MSTTAKKSDVAEAIRSTLTSPNVADSNWEAANVVDALDSIGTRIALGLRDRDSADAPTCIRESGERIADALMSAGREIASAITGLAEAIRAARGNGDEPE
jgi:hypothetical protein